MQSIALIAPDSGLENVEAEVRAISLALRPVALRNGVTIKDVVDLLSTQAWDIVWFACHGGREGIYLGQSPDIILDRSMLIQMIRAAGASLVVLNTCESEEDGLFLHYATGATVVCTVAPVNDTTAYATGALFARYLASGQDVRTAYMRARPGDAGLAQVYRMFPDQATIQSRETETLMKFMVAALEPLSKRLDSVDERLERLESSQASAHIVTLPPRRRWAWVSGAMLFAAPFLLSDALRMAGWQLDWLPYAMLTVGALPFAVVLMLYGFGMVRP